MGISHSVELKASIASPEAAMVALGPGGRYEYEEVCGTMDSPIQISCAVLHMHRFFYTSLPAGVHE